MPSILFICTANRFRSPIAAAAFTRALDKAGVLDDWKVNSAGTWTTAGQEPIHSAVRAADGIGLDIRLARSKPVSQRLLDQSDMILVMEAGQREAILNEFLNMTGRVYLLAEMVDGTAYDIPDPVGNPSQGSPEEIAQEIDALIGKGFERICRLARKTVPPA